MGVSLQAKYLRLVQSQQLPQIFKSSLTAQLVMTLLTASLTSLATSPAAAAGDVTTQSSSGGADQQPSEQQQQQQEEGVLDVEHAVGLVRGLVAVPRFDMMVMCLGSKDKAVLRQLWDQAEAAVEGEAHEQLASVRSKYRL